MTAITLGQFATLTSGGASETAGFIATQMEKWRRQLQHSYTLGQEAKGSLNELYQVFNECRNSNWDAYGAKPVSKEILQYASQLLAALPLGTPAPTLGAEPDGQITLEWHRSPRRTLSVSVSQEGDLHYAALIGVGRHYGTEPFYGEAPKIILDLIRRVLAA